LQVSPDLFGSTHYKRIELVAVEIAKVPGVEALTARPREEVYERIRAETAASISKGKISTPWVAR